MNFLNLNDKSKLIRQILPKLYIAILCTTILCGMFMYVYSMDIMLNTKRQEGLSTLEELKDAMDEFGHTQWYVDYWKNNYESMDIDYSNDTYGSDIMDKQYELFDAFEEEYGDDYINVIYVTKTTSNGTQYYDIDYSQINPEEQSPKLQKMMAEFAYATIRYYFDEMKSGTDYQHLYSLTRISDEEMMYLFCGRRQSEQYGNDKKNIYTLGKTETVPKSKYPALYKTYESGEILSGEALLLADRRPLDAYHFYYPICDDDGNTICVLALSGKLENIDELVMKPFVIMIIFFVAAMLLCAYIAATMIKTKAILPINTIQSSVKVYAETKNAEKLKNDLCKLDMDNEIGYLSSELSQMGDELTKYIEDVKNMSTIQERLNVELDLATGIQKSSLTKDFSEVPAGWNIKMFASMDPAKEVGGDFYDYKVLDDDHIAIIIGDVSGKGIPAALFMMICLTLIDNITDYSQNPDKIMEAVNKALCSKDYMGMFVTAWIGVLEISTGVVRTANAGHENPIIRHADGSIEEIMIKHDLVLAAIGTVDYHVNEIKLERGDMLMVYTDGVPEAINTANEQYGVIRLKECLSKTADADPEESIRAVSADMSAFVGEADQFDDTTMFALCY